MRSVSLDSQRRTTPRNIPVGTKWPVQVGLWHSSWHTSNEVPGRAQKPVISIGWNNSITYSIGVITPGTNLFSAIYRGCTHLHCLDKFAASQPLAHTPEVLVHEETDRSTLRRDTNLGNKKGIQHTPGTYPPRPSTTCFMKVILPSFWYFLGLPEICPFQESVGFFYIKSIVMLGSSGYTNIPLAGISTSSIGNTSFIQGPFFSVATTIWSY